MLECINGGKWFDRDIPLSVFGLGKICLILGRSWAVAMGCCFCRFWVDVLWMDFVTIDEPPGDVASVLVGVCASGAGGIDGLP